MNSIAAVLKGEVKINTILTRSEYLMVMEALALELVPQRGSVDLVTVHDTHQKIMRRLAFDSHFSRHCNDRNTTDTFIALCDIGFIVTTDGGRPYLMPGQSVHRTATATHFLAQVPQRVNATLDIFLERKPSVLEFVARAAK